MAQDDDKEAGADTPGSKLQERWWVDEGKPRERAPRPLPPEVVAGASFYRVAAGYSQEVARSRLTDLNLKLLQEGNPPPNGSNEYWTPLGMKKSVGGGCAIDQVPMSATGVAVVRDSSR